MGFEQLLGNPQLRENLSRSIQNGHISHFYLISGPAGSGRHTLARLLAAAILCRGNGKPCLGCDPCRKVMESSHPDFITIDDPEKKNVPVDLIREARADIYIQPNEADYKIYLFPRAQDMLPPAQNALLKVLEEPPKYGIFILLTDNPERLLPTVRSRCTELALQPLPEVLLRTELAREFPDASAEALEAAILHSGGFLGQAKQVLTDGAVLLPQTEAFLAAYLSRDAVSLVQTLVPMEKWKRDQLIPALEQWTAQLQRALSCRCGMPAVSPQIRELSTRRTAQELMQGISALQKCTEYAQQNVSPAAICGYLSWELR